jgi:uncharacterized protein YprB with RNaseH-like and TPR domain
MDESLRKRLESLNRGPMPAASPISAAAKKVVEVAMQAIAPRRPSRALVDQPAPRSASSSARAAAGLLQRGEVVDTPVGQHLRICMEIDQLWQGGTNLLAARQEFLRLVTTSTTTNGSQSPPSAHEFTSFIAALPDRTLALDLETCGLAGSALFLIGVLRQVAGVPRVELLLSRNYGEEAAVLFSLWQIVADHDVLLTFNGKSFDWPMVVERSVRHRLPVPANRELWTHIDVLHHARRRWKRQLPNCRLQTLERHVCRRTREGDIPGHAIPAAYANYVRTGFEREMEAVLYHNALDLVTLFDLAHRLAA